MLSRLAPYRWRMLIGFCIKVAGTLAELMLPFILTHILENVIADMQIDRVILFGGLMIVCSAVACICNVIANRMAARVSMIFSRQLRKDLF